MKNEVELVLCIMNAADVNVMSISRRLEHYKSSEVFEIDVSLKLFPLNPRVCVDLQNKFPSVLIET